MTDDHGAEREKAKARGPSIYVLQGREGDYEVTTWMVRAFTNEAAAARDVSRMNLLVAQLKDTRASDPCPEADDSTFDKWWEHDRQRLADAQRDLHDERFYDTNTEYCVVEIPLMTHE